ncbi:MAG: riboflavin synthase [candidate division WOR-3 bacterium]
MFTGIVKTIGEIIEIENKGKGKRVKIKYKGEIELKEGDSISIDGACITIEKLDGKTFDVFLSEETLKTTKFGKVLRKGYFVNLEPSLKIGDTLGGHFVTGHVDGIGKIKKIIKNKEEIKMEIEFDRNFEKYLYQKAQIAIDGISLTLFERKRNRGIFKIIPYTYKNTTISLKRSGDLVNVEFDVFAKIVENLLKGGKKI